MKKLSEWFDGLTRAGQITVVSVISILGLGTYGAIAAPVSQETTATPAAMQVKQPVVTTEDLTETEAVAFEKTTVETASLNKGLTQVTTAGVNGVRTKIFKITKTNGTETARELVSDNITTQPITEVTSVGTYVAPAPAARVSSNCDPNYGGACVPIASDVDCGGGSGNGPAYVYGTVTVIGRDIYDLDRDGDGYGCDR